MKIAKKTTSLFLTFLMVLTLLFVPTASVSAEETKKQEWKTFEELVDEKGYLNGIQQPYLVQTSTGNDIGSSKLYGYNASNFSEAAWYELFQNSKAMGFDIVQFWPTYQLGGILFDEDWQVVGIEPEFKKNFPRILEIAEECGVYLSITLIEHEETAFPAGNSAKYKNVRYEEIYRFMHNEKSTKLFIDNWVKPVLEMTKKHKNVIMANIFAEPEANGARWSVQTGASWENMVKFLNALIDAVNEVNPSLVTYVGATQGVPDTFPFYENVNLDCYGYDYYSSGDLAHDTSEFYLDKPFVYGEFGIDPPSYSMSDEFMTAYFANYLETASAQGVKAGFYWLYGFPNSAMSVLDAKSRLRPYTWAIRSWALDNEYSITGYEGIDAPTFMYSTSEAIRFYGSRGATNITMQRSKDGKTAWKSVLSFNPDDAEAVVNYEFGAMMYEWLDPETKEGETWSYRLIASDAEGNERVSEIITITADYVTCSPEENLLKNHSFEEGPIKTLNLNTGVYSDGAEGWLIVNQSTTFKDYYDTVHYQNGEEARTGKGSIYRANKLMQEVTLKPNTDYTFTYYYKFDEVEGYWYSTANLVFDYPVSEAPDPAKIGNYYVPEILMQDKNKKIGWVRHTEKFNSGDETNATVLFYSWHGGSNGRDTTNIIDWHIDDVYLFETKK